ncbi:hypothetical protein BSKO_10802 [Bryopsis sp. KO-2023]|nr:hypothetical protein BSKO_10802 [Bryopsis sp. KO-2023]
MQSGRRALTGAPSLRKHLLGLIERGPVSGKEIRWETSDASPPAAPTLAPTPTPGLTPPPTTAPGVTPTPTPAPGLTPTPGLTSNPAMQIPLPTMSEIEVDEALTDPASIADGWFNPNPVKLTPDCPGSMVSMFVGRTIPQRMYLDGEEEWTQPAAQQKEDRVAGVSQFLVEEDGDKKEEEKSEKVQPEENWGRVITGLGQDASSKRLEEGTTEDETPEEEFEVTVGLFSENSSDKLTMEDVNKYYPFDRKLLPEAFPEYYKIEVPDDVRKPEPKGGSKSLTTELKLSGKDNLLAREPILELMSELGSDNEALKGKRILLHGRPGCGKSIALAATAEWARKKKWLVLYIPTAQVFGNDLFFMARPGSLLYDTPNVAKDILRSVRDSHKDALQEMKQELDLTDQEVDGSQLGTTLLDLCDIGIAAQQPAVTVDAAFKLLHELVYVKRDTPALVLIDDYNALYWKTTYGRWVSDKSKEMITIDRTKLGQAMRFLEKEADEKLQACVIAAPTFSQGIRPNLWVPLAKDITKKELELFTPEDMKRLFCYFWNCGSIAPLEDGDVLKAWFLCGGNGHDVQKSLSVLC